MEVTTAPACRVGWQGATLDYVVKASGATEVRIPEEGLKGLRVRVVDQRQSGDGVEARLQVQVVDSTVY